MKTIFDLSDGMLDAIAEVEADFRSRPIRTTMAEFNLGNTINFRSMDSGKTILITARDKDRGYEFYIHVDEHGTHRRIIETVTYDFDAEHFVDMTYPPKHQRGNNISMMLHENIGLIMAKTTGTVDMFYLSIEVSNELL